MNIKLSKVSLILLLITYIIVAQFNEFIADILSPLYFLGVGLLVLQLSKKMGVYKKFYIILGLAPVIWGFIDFLWFILSHFSIYDPGEMSLFTLLYFLPNMCFFLAAFFYFLKNVSHWNRNQLILDILVVSILILGVASALYFENINLSSFDFISIVALIAYVITDVLSILILLVMTASSRIGKLSTSIKYVGLGFLVYFLADLIFIDVEINGIYEANTITDILFMVSFLFIAMAAALRVRNPEPDVYHNTEPQNLGKSYVTWYLLVPIGVLFILGRLKIAYMASFFFVILMYQLMSYYVQKSLVSDILYDRERQYKKELEKLVAEKTQDLRESRDALKYKTISDALTGLYNREYFYESINNKIDGSEHFSIFYLDLDRFKVINDLHGHNMGDMVLKKVAKRLANNLSISTDIFRIGGDEFSVIIDETDSSYINFMAKEITDLINKTVLIDDYAFSIGVSLGISRYPRDGETANELMKHADIAMYHAKHYHPEQHVIFSSHMVEGLERRSKIELLLETADFDESFDLYYQPQFDTASGKLHGMEALIRWYHSEEGFISPGEFIPIAEEIGLIRPISDWVLKKAMKQIKEWNSTYKAEWVMGINISPISLNSVSFMPNLNTLIKSLDIKPHFIDFEITEHSAMNTAPIVQEIFTTLSELGIQISIDDFGTGYSSLSYIKRFDVDTLKIAKELIDNITEDQDDHLIVKAIVMMANGLGLKTIAEGVETKEQLNLLKELGCNRIQGYYYGRPVDSKTFEGTYLKEVD